jgi:hypothetical protein
MSVDITKPFVLQAFKSAVAETVTKTAQVILPHLIHHNAHYQFGLVLCTGAYHKKNKKKSKSKAHATKIGVEKEKATLRPLFPPLRA